AFDDERDAAPMDVLEPTEVPLGVLDEELVQGDALTRDGVGRIAEVVVEADDHPVLEPRLEELEHRLRARVHVAVDIRGGDVVGRTVGAERRHRVLEEAFGDGVDVPWHAVARRGLVELLHAVRGTAAAEAAAGPPSIAFVDELGKPFEGVVRPEVPTRSEFTDRVVGAAHGVAAPRPELHVVAGDRVQLERDERVPEEVADALTHPLDGLVHRVVGHRVTSSRENGTLPTRRICKPECVTATLMDGTTLARDITDRTAARAATFLEQHGRRPTLAAVIVGDDPASVTYVRMKRN